MAATTMTRLMLTPFRRVRGGRDFFGSSRTVPTRTATSRSFIPSPLVGSFVAYTPPGEPQPSKPPVATRDGAGRRASGRLSSAQDPPQAGLGTSPCLGMTE